MSSQWQRRKQSVARPAPPAPNRYEYWIVGQWQCGGKSVLVADGLTTDAELSTAARIRGAQEQFAKHFKFVDKGAAIVGESAAFVITNRILLRVWYEAPAEAVTPEATQDSESAAEPVH